MKDYSLKYDSKPQFLVAAASSGSGKTTFTIGLLRLLSNRGLKVASFKCGPDYIDTQFHNIASGRKSVNLDLYMGSPEHVQSVYARYSDGYDVAVVEGVMGLFDGYDKIKGSSADVAVTLNLPVILIVNSASTAYSVGAVIYGFKNFNPAVEIAGVIFNRVASDSHYSMLKDACAAAGVKCLGYIKRMPGLEVPSRHLGLAIGNGSAMDDFAAKAADALESTVDIDELLSSVMSPVRPNVDLMACYSSSDDRKLKIAIAADDAFNFMYEENVAVLKRHPSYSITIERFSPIEDAQLPDADIVYLPGGYPELYAEKLEANESMRASVKEFAECGGRIWAECGGMIYLCMSLDGRSMCGVLPFECTMSDPRLTLGYRAVELYNGMELKGHEFHYSKITGGDDVPVVAVQYNARGQKVSTAMYRYKNVYAGYTHIYWGETDMLKLWDL